MNIVILDTIGFTAEQREKLTSLRARVYDDVPKSEADIVERIKDAEIITANYIDITPSIIDSAPNLKWIIAPAVGFEWIDAKYAASKDVRVCNCRTFNSQSVAELAVGLIVGISRKLTRANDDLRKGSFRPKEFLGSEIQGKRLGLVGHGNIGKRIDSMMTGLGIKVSYVDSKSSEQEVDELMRNSDYVLLCCQLNDKTRHMINANRLALMKPSAYLVNVSRGAIVEQAALIEALKSKKIAGAALDVFDGEPLTGEVSDEIHDLVNLPNVVAVPHIGASTKEAQDKLGDEVIADIEAILAGNPINVVSV